MIIRNLEHNRQYQWQGDYLSLPYVERPRFLYHLGYYDGPISGVCLYQGEKRYFDTCDEVWYEEYITDDPDYNDGVPFWEKGWSRRFVILDAPAEYMAEIERRHELFRKYVGHHTDYDENGKRALGALHPQSEWKKFYDSPEPGTFPKMGDCPALAWFGLPPQEGEIPTP